MTQEMKATIELVNKSSKEVEPMSKADKMFKDMKYVKMIENKEYISYSSVKSNIIFSLNDREVLSEKMGVNEHIAIHEKMKDLGWLNERSI